jgi:hypothetical protein
MEMLLSDLDNIIIPTSDPNESLDFLIDSIHSIFDLHAPFVTKVIRERHLKKFMSHDTTTLMKERDSLASYVALHPYDHSGKLNLNYLRILVK